MKVDEYQVKASSTIVFDKGSSLSYLTLGLVSEVLEVFEIILTNSYVHKENFDITNIYYEFGDVLWYLAIFSKDMDVLFSSITKTEYFEDKEPTRDITEIGNDVMYRILKKLTSTVKKKIRGDNDEKADYIIITLLKQVYESLVEIMSYYKVSIDTVAQMNIDKLAKRKKTGKIKGNGDKR